MQFLENNLRSETSRSPTTNSNRTPRKRLLNILLNSNSTTEDDTEEEILPSVSGNRRTKRRRRNFSSSTSSSYTSSSLTTNSNNTGSVSAAAQKQQSSSVEQDLIAFRTRSRTHSVEHLEIESPSRANNSLDNSKLKQSTGRYSSSKSQQQKVNSEVFEENSHLSVSDKFVTNNNKKTIFESVNNINNRKSKEQSNNYQNTTNNNINLNLNNSASADNRQSQQKASRKLRSHKVDTTTAGKEKQSVPKRNLRRKTSSPSHSNSGVTPKKRQRISDNNNRNTVERNIGLDNSKVDSTNTKTPLNLGARLAKGREPHTFDHELLQPSTSNQQQHLGHPPTSSQNLLRRSSRGKSSTTGSCVS